MQKVNYQRKLDELINNLSGTPRAGVVPRLLLHSCCAPCSSYCLEYLSRYFAITVLYYNPNISPREEFLKRAEEQRRLISELSTENPVELVVDDYDPNEFFSAVKGLEDCEEGGERCFVCYRLRLERAARYAAAHRFDYFCSTLSISPLKNAQKLNEIGEELSEIYKVPNLPNDFKKKGGYLRSIELSREYGLYRQNYCGCVFSQRERKESK
ncbi:MAG: epoxyqueuosine reductase QueH [Oscillospiraceae bacterium]|nr:epoxyqueuosine reductase QueH [Oscillospiraceae bacterium]